MKNVNKIILALVLVIPMLFISCNDDDANAGPTQLNSKVYQLRAVGNSGVSGTATFIENSNNTLSIKLDLQNTPAGGNHPAHIHFNTAAEGGAIALSLENVVGGKSNTTFTTLDDGTPISYQGLINYDGYINVHLSATELATVVAQGDIGQNELTGETVSYVLNEKDVVGISGTVEFAERVNQTTLATITLTGTPDGGNHPAHIHANDIATGGPIVVSFNPVNGTTGVSTTQIATLDSGAAVTYDNLLTINGYVNVHLSDQNLATIVAQGNIGANSNVESKIYSVANSGASAYVFNGSGLVNVNNPDFTFKRGSTYTFNVTSPGHPFLIKSVQGTGTANSYSSGVTNNGAVSGAIIFTVPMDAPNTLFYNCQFHGSMTGTITVTN